MLATNVRQPFGFAPWNIDARCYARGGAFTAGQVGQLDLANTDEAVTNNKVGDPASGWANIVVPTATGIKAYPLAVALEAIADDAAGQWRAEGIVYAYVVKASGNIAKGEALYAVSGQRYLTADGSAGVRVQATAEEGATAPTTPTLIRVHLKASNGKGTFVS